MTKDEIIEIAKQAWISEQEAQLITEFDMAYISCTYLTDLVAFAKLVAAKEREACALRAEDFLTEPEPDWDGDFWNQAVERVANAIRARGESHG
jgi:hypothetical protein